MNPVPISSAGFTNVPASGTTGEPVSFKGVATDIYPGLGFIWKWGDGTESAGPTPTHVYAAAGSYEVTMTAKDELTGSTTTPVTHAIAVGNPVPVTTPPAPPPVAVSIVTPPVVAVPPAPNSTFTAGTSSFNQTTGMITFTETVADPGTFSWLVTFQNGKFGVFASSARCKSSQVRIGGKCLPAKIVFARGRRAFATPGTVTFKLKPSASGLKALKNALKQKKGLPLTVAFTFQSTRGGSPVTRTRTITVKLKGH
jgi:PKD repeat protein